ncbi:MAG: O-antigen ligase family protein [Limisphaerales bacterium]
MNNAPDILRSLIIYAVIVPVAVFIGYLLTDPMQLMGYNASAMMFVGVLIMVMIFPLLLRWHYPLMLLSWNAGAIAFFIKGHPDFQMAMVALSLGISLLDRAMNSEKHFIRVPQITWPLICMLGVIFLTAKLTGGFGLKAFDSDVYGGRKYIFLIVGILGYFALTARRIPPEQAKFFVSLFFLGQTMKLIGDLYPITPSFLHFIFWVFPPNSTIGAFELGVTRLGGAGLAGLAIALWMMAMYGIRGIFLSRKPWRVVLFFLATGLVFLGGFRSALMMLGEVFVLLFFLERLYRTPLLPIFAAVGVLAMVLAIPLAPKLPFTFQRTLAFLPINLSQDARESAQNSSDWRMNMWKALLPQVPKYLLLGKGYAFSREDFEVMGTDTAFSSVDAGQQALALSADYHNGILSVVLPFGLWGLICYVWFMVAGLWVLYCNWKHGDPALQTLNLILFALCLQDFLGFASCVSGLPLNISSPIWAGYVGLSVAMNNGVCRSAPQAVSVKPPAYPTRPFPRPRPAFQR